MKERLLAAKDGKQESLLTTSARSLEFDCDAFEDLSYWVNHDRKQALRVIRLIQETQTDHRRRGWSWGETQLTENIGWFDPSRTRKFAFWRAVIIFCLNYFSDKRIFACQTGTGILNLL